MCPIDLSVKLACIEKKRTVRESERPVSHLLANQFTMSKTDSHLLAVKDGRLIFCIHLLTKKLNTSRAHAHSLCVLHTSCQNS